MRHDPSYRRVRTTASLWCIDGILPSILVLVVDDAVGSVVMEASNWYL